MVIFDILRIIAALMVFTIHLFIFIPQLPRAVCDILSNGGYGVSIFFVISGFLIFQSIENSKSLKEYYVKRISRIVPSYYAILLFGIILWDKVLNKMPEDTYLHMGWLRYFLFLNTWIPSTEYDAWNNLWGLWTISCFAFFYCIAPFLKKWINTYRKSVWFMLMAMVVAFVSSKVLTILFTRVGASVPYMLAVDIPIYSLSTFSIGMCGYFAYKEKREKEIMRVLVVILAAFIGINMYNRMFWGVLTALVMMSFLDYQIENVKCKNVLKTLGKYSFSLYLVHLPVLEILYNYGITGVKFLALGLLLSVLAAYLLYTLIESPCARVIKRKFL